MKKEILKRVALALFEIQFEKHIHQRCEKQYKGK